MRDAKREVKLSRDCRSNGRTMGESMMSKNNYLIYEINGYMLPSGKKLKLKEVRELINSADDVKYTTDTDGVEYISIKIDNNTIKIKHYE